MANKSTHITSQSHFRTILASSTYVVADFYADWCGPCKTIAPIFESLAASEGKPGRLSFVKVNVDSCQDVARTYGVSAMPTFLIFKNGTVTDTIRGADPSSLRSAVLAASAGAAKAPAKQSASFSSQGHVLGGPSVNSRSAPSVVSGPGSVGDTVTRFAMLYFTTLFSLNPAASAETSQWNINRGRSR